MYTLTQLIPWRQLLVQQGPILLTSMVIAELFYKFHSFTLETVAFLATWYVIDAAVKTVSQLLGRDKELTGQG